MSQLISSAVAGKKAAPKAPVRRRQPPPPPPPPPKAASPPSIQSQSEAAPAATSAPPSDVPLSPPQTQAHIQPSVQPEAPRQAQPPRQPTPPVPSSPPPSDDGQTQLEQFVRAQTPEATQHEVPAAPMTAQQAATSVEQAVATSTVARTDGIEAAGSTSAPAKSTRKRKNDPSQAPPSKIPAKRQKRSSARSNATVQAQVNEDEHVADQAAVLEDEQHQNGHSEAANTGAATRSTRRPRAAKNAGTDTTAKKRRRLKSATTTPEDDREPPEAQSENGDDTETAAPTPKKSRKKRRKTRGQAEGETGEQRDAENGEQHEIVDDSSDPEDHEIDPEKLSMYELTHYKKYGKVSDREKKMREINWGEVRRKRNEEIARIMAGEQQGKRKKRSADETPGDAVPSTEGPPETAEDGEEVPEAGNAANAATRSSQPPPAPNADLEAEQEAPARGLQLRIVNGVIVEDEASLTINRAGDVNAANDALDGVIEEENDLTQRLNRTTWINSRRRDPTARIPMWKAKSDPWTEAETERFYEQLAIFGTDFDILSRMFPPKTRRQLKAKFNREERLDDQRITDTLLGKGIRPAAAMSLKTYAEETGRDLEFFAKYKSAEHADEVIRESMREREEAMLVAMAEEEEVQRQAGIAATQREAARKDGEKRRAGAKRGNRRGHIGAGTLGGAQLLQDLQTFTKTQVCGPLQNKALSFITRVNLENLQS
ncbi:hypothetical protein LTR91_014083 [Friedmanniomyces endolithicus]|uniref:Myb-like domain-containing protein n=2 Tax=Friedmanniomyces endolithicus TaxID=329885 RepID=A0AAN6KD33_9PEZI|nr:hypothetical protein LTS09_013352 [Friedmanniomyces endolithicus]KAK0267488.1 hypothetical protein LTS00_017786 [Friedmanniomyces endolithicus]KAK0291650.1 hypothetical protein LTR35_001077 [Friedmanniomyces endolithicus]KAK0905152.1 hypothetical protein LTR57_018422 [Friedmanniomyces endolithicus]KAK0975281.1 hypothetical protein LTR91_014083 [Friedmanniomyces endolithicus]